MPLTSLLHDLALLYLGLTYGADGRLDDVEKEAMRDQLRQWSPGMDPTRLDHILSEALLSYTNGLDEHRFDALLSRLNAGLDPEGRQRVLDDLRALAQADARVQREELAFITRVERAWAGDASSERG